jgi:hypothetical protein
MIFKRALPLILACLLTAILCACPAQPPATEIDGQPEATVVVTRDFGKELILEEEVELEPGTNAMAALQAVADVETKYGGGFVQAINGISSEYEGGSQRDWFYYINGIALNLGAQDYTLQDGDVEHWDFRHWSYLQFVPAIIGDFPQPFLSKLKPTAVVYEEFFSKEAQGLAEKLGDWGVAEVITISDEQLSEETKEASNLVIIAGLENELISELNEVHKKLGFFAILQQDKIIVLDGGGNLAGEFNAGYGLIQATQNPWHPKGVGSGESVVFMITGTDTEGVKSAANALIKNSDGLRYAFAVLVKNSEISKIP